MINVKGALLTLKSINIKNGAGQHAMYISGSSANAKTTVTLESGSISNNTSSQAGTVYVGNYADFVMNGGSISNNTAGEGGGVTMSGVSSTFTMSGDAKISNNIATGAAGSLSVHNGTANLNGGSISGNQAMYCGGIEAYAYNDETMKVNINLNGTHVDNNTATDMYGGIFVS